MNYLYDSPGRRFAIDFYKYPHATYIFCSVLIITLAIRAFITSAQDIFKAAAFNYARNEPTGPFSVELIEASFEKK